jgi:plasmid stabilization system protein ParE
MTEDRFPVIWSPEALDDIDHLWDYYADVAGRTVAEGFSARSRKLSQTSKNFPSPDDHATTCARRSVPSAPVSKSCFIG